MLEKLIKRLLAPIVREVIQEEQIPAQVLNQLGATLKEILDSGECDSLKRD